MVNRKEARELNNPGFTVAGNQGKTGRTPEQGAHGKSRRIETFQSLTTANRLAPLSA